MKRIPLTFLLCTLLACSAAPTAAAELKLGTGDSIESVLGAQKDKRVTVRLRSGQELTGTVKLVTTRLLHLGALGGREFFDAVIPLETVEAVLVRTKN